MMKVRISPQFVSTPFVHYVDAIDEMEQHVNAIIRHDAHDKIWFLEHEPVYTKGSSAKDDDLLNSIFPVYETGRGGQFTYHGPGQLMAYCMFDLHHYKKDIKAYIQALEAWIILFLQELSIDAFVKDGRVGVWVVHNGCEKKIAAIGVRLKKWVTWHGFCLNINPNLSHYQGIVPCGIKDAGVTSLAELCINTSRADVEKILQTTFQNHTFFNAHTCSKNQLDCV
jgi:lipoyl(octanoyl) transferase